MININKILKEFLESEDTHLLFYEDENGDTQVKSITVGAGQ